MGEAKEIVKGTPTKKKRKTASEQNLITRINEAMDDVSTVINIKEGDVTKEGAAQRGENVRKAGVMRAVYSLLSAAKRLMEDY